MALSDNDRRIPGKNVLLAALRGWESFDHLFLDAAADLVELHYRLLTDQDRYGTGAGAERVGLVHDIDCWVVLAAPLPYMAARLHTESIGVVIDRLARLSAQLWVTADDPSDTQFEEIWIELDELATAYQQLADDVLAGICRLPDNSAISQPNEQSPRASLLLDAASSGLPALPTRHRTANGANKTPVGANDLQRRTLHSYLAVAISHDWRVEAVTDSTAVLTLLGRPRRKLGKLVKAVPGLSIFGVGALWMALTARRPATVTVSVDPDGRKNVCVAPESLPWPRRPS
ncbi:DUF4254 domain-containing protein [Nocardia sp. NPDC059239]|uniref:DUF4254 domain-containing protein n=1 Tax=unclassified Nocardia TaxID=2637762 RepID=UPI0036AAE2C0